MLGSSRGSHGLVCCVRERKWQASKRLPSPRIHVPRASRVMLSRVICTDHGYRIETRDGLSPQRGERTSKQATDSTHGPQYMWWSFCYVQSPLPPPLHSFKATRELVHGISVYSVGLLSMFKCLKDFFACQDERLRLSITKRPCLLTSPVWGA